MELFTVSDVVRVTEARLIGRDTGAWVKSVTHDSRKVSAGTLFVAIPGQRADGHDYLEEVFRGGAVAALVQRIPPGAENLEGVLCLVEDTVRALGLLARDYRTRFGATVWGITGSLGKTSTKEMVASILKRRYCLLKSPGNLNTEVGLPLAIFGLQSHHQMAILEMGARKPGDISWLCSIARPEGALVTNVAESHVGIFGSVDQVARTKSELVEGVGRGTVCLNADDSRVRDMARKARGRVVFYGTSPGNEVLGEDVSLDEESRPEFTLRIGRQRRRVRLPLHGAHQVGNALGAAAVAHAAGMDLEDIAAGLESMELLSMRMSVLRSGDLTILDDSYNSSPTSTRAALEVLRRMPASQKVAILGDMLELGEMAQTAHLQVGEEVARSGLSFLITVGDLAGLIHEGALSAGFSSERAFHYRSVEGLLGDLSGLVPQSSVTLVKGSRGLRMERVVRALQDKGGF